MSVQYKTVGTNVKIFTIHVNGNIIGDTFRLLSEPYSVLEVGIGLDFRFPTD